MPIIQIAAAGPVAASGPAGSNVVCTPVSDTAGRVTATLTGRTGTIFTLTFGGAPQVPPAVLLTPANNAAARVAVCARSTAGVVTVAAAPPNAPPAETTPTWSYLAVFS